MKTILITGATGFLGSHITRALHAAGHRVIIIKRATSRLERIEDITQDLAIFDIEDGPETVFKDMDKIDAIVHTATSYGRHGETISQIFEANTAFPLRLLEVAIRSKRDTFINTDTILNKYLNNYSLTKRHFTEWGRYLADNGDLRFINIRLEHMYGPGDDPSKFTTHVIRSCMQNVPELKLTPGEQRRDFIYIDDVVAGYMRLLQVVEGVPPGFSQYDLGTGEAVTIRHFVETVHRLTGSSTTLDFGGVPYRKNEIMCSEADVAPLRNLGWCCKTSLEDGILKTINKEST